MSLISSYTEASAGSAVALANPYLDMEERRRDDINRKIGVIDQLLGQIMDGQSYRVENLEAMADTRSVRSILACIKARLKMRDCASRNGQNFYKGGYLRKRLENVYEGSYLRGCLERYKGMLERNKEMRIPRAKRDVKGLEKEFAEIARLKRKVSDDHCLNACEEEMLKAIILGWTKELKPYRGREKPEYLERINKEYGRPFFILAANRGLRVREIEKALQEWTEYDFVCLPSEVKEVEMARRLADSEEWD